MNTRLPSPEKPWQENYAIMLKPSSDDGNGDAERKMVGVIGIPRLSHDEMAAEVGYGIMVSEWGKGYASEALSRFTEYYFDSKSKSFSLSRNHGCPVLIAIRMA